MHLFATCMRHVAVGLVLAIGEGIRLCLHLWDPEGRLRLLAIVFDALAQVALHLDHRVPWVRVDGGAYLVLICMYACTEVEWRGRRGRRGSGKILTIFLCNRSRIWLKI